jgi:Xaa-Pro dipeptidase
MHYDQRLHKLQKLLQQHGLDAVALLPGPNLFYLTGLSFHLMERPVIGVFTANGASYLLVPNLERAKAEAASLELELFSYGEAPGASLEALRSGLGGLSLPRIGLEPLTMRYFELELLQSALGDTEYLAAEDLITKLRLIKSEQEIRYMQRAAEIAERAFEETLPLIIIGMTELELAGELTVQLLRAGSEPETPFSPIVASGPNAAFPHAVPTDRQLSAGDTLILDWGATHKGYMSDITRTLALGELEQELTTVYSIVAQANASGLDAVRPGATCDEIDHAARQVIADAGYGEYFIHRTGHGLGLEAHEPPNIRADEQTVLQTGMAFTIEPGIYLPGRGGVRIEDDVIVADQGARSLTTLSRELQILG